MKNLRFLLLCAISILPTVAIAKDIKPVGMAINFCAFEATKAYLQGPGRKDQSDIFTVIVWCMRNESYSFNSHSCSSYIEGMIQGMTQATDASCYQQMGD